MKFSTIDRTGGVELGTEQLMSKPRFILKTSKYGIPRGFSIDGVEI